MSKLWDILWVRDLDKPEYTLVVDSQDVQTVLADIGMPKAAYTILIVKYGEFEYKEVWGGYGVVPKYNKAMERIF